MRTVLIGRKEIRKKRFAYFLLAEECGEYTENYGVRITDADGSGQSVSDVTLSQDKILNLIALLIKHRVTPAALRDVVDDWLLL